MPTPSPTTPGEPGAPAGSVGHRLAVARVRAGLTRRELATRARLRVGRIIQVERGDLPASPALTAAVAAGLHLDTDTLYGQPYPLAPDADQAAIPALRAALDAAEDPEPIGEPMTVPELRARLRDADTDRAHGRYAQLAAALPEVLQHGHALRTRTPPGPAAPLVWALLADAGLLAQSVAYRFGYLDLALRCAERARHAAAHSEDLLRLALAAAARSRLHLHRGQHAAALRLLDRAHTLIADHTGPTADAVRVHLHLCQVIAYARHGAADTAETHLATAYELIARGVPTSPYPTVHASATNADLYGVALAVEVDDPTAALHRAGQIKIPTGEPPARLARHHLDLARAHALHGEHPQALDALAHARVLAPQLVCYHPQAHETLHFLTETARRNPDTLAGFARWIGVTL
ncbi:MAG: helix-turn-helix domain-containing protein [Sciscionella sp.]